jgi:hypothetical protein
MTESPSLETPSAERGYEVRDVTAKTLAGLGVMLCLALVLLGALVWAFMAGLAAGQTSVASTAAVQRATDAPAPQLQTDPAGDLAKKRAAEDSVLNSYGWIDRQQGTVRIPIDRAMDLLATRKEP